MLFREVKIATQRFAQKNSSQLIQSLAFMNIRIDVFCQWYLFRRNPLVNHLRDLILMCSNAQNSFGGFLNTKKFHSSRISTHVWDIKLVDSKILQVINIFEIIYLTYACHTLAILIEFTSDTLVFQNWCKNMSRDLNIH